MVPPALEESATGEMRDAAPPPRPPERPERPRPERDRRDRPRRPETFVPAPTEGEPAAVVSRKGAERIAAGHPWIYESDVADLTPTAHPGEVVRVLDGRGWFLGRAFLSLQSKIRLRMLGREEGPTDREFFLERLRSALALRERCFPGESAYRLVHGEADGLPGLVVDRYGDHLVLQLLTQGADARRSLWVELLDELLKPACIVERSDVKVRALEGLEPVKQVLKGEPRRPLEYREGEVAIGLDVLEGQKTGSFLDQRENHLAAGRYARGKCLDCFSYVGGFALQMAKAGGQVTAVEISDQACGQIRANAERNGLKLDVVCANVFDYLRDQLDAGARYDTIVLDPPAFAKNKDSVEAAIRGYKEINLRALQLLEPGGVLISASCSYHVGEEAYEALLAEAAGDARKSVQIVEKRGAGRDHPVLLSLRETRYLKCYVLRVG